MASLFNSRRKPKRIARDVSEEQVELEDEDVGTAVRRPNVGPKVKSKLRISFDPSEAQTEDTIDEPEKVQRPRPSSGTKELPKHTAALHLFDRHDEARPSYSKSYLDELRNSTPSTPKDLSLYNSSAEDEPQVTGAVDVAAKFGPSADTSGSKIPSAAEIKEKKDRRARLAKEHAARSGKDDDNFISLEDYDSDGEFKPQRLQVGNVLQRYEEKDTRLVRDEEDFAEGFEEFTEDGSSRRIMLSKRAQRDQTRKEQEQRREMIEQAEGLGSDEDDESDSDASLRHAYESAQTHRGMEGLDARKSQQRQAKRPRQPEKITPITNLAVGLSRIRELVEQSEAVKEKAQRRLVEIQKEKVSIEAEQARIQSSLTELGEQLEISMSQPNGSSSTKESQAADRGLESFGGSLPAANV